MSANSSSFANASLHPSALSSSTNLYSLLQICFTFKSGILSMTAFTIASILVLLPLCTLVLCLGLQRWRRQRTSITVSHSDFFTYNMVAIELMSIFGSTLTCLGIYTYLRQILTVGVTLLLTNSCGQALFHVLTCVERYLAVVHPITYLSLRKAKWIRIRNCVCGCVWLLSFATTYVMNEADQVFILYINFCVLVFILIAISFCSLCVLRVLIRPGLGERGGDRQRVDQSKLRAFYTIMAILVVLLFRFGGCMLSTALYFSLLLGETGKCDVWLSVIWFGFPSSLVLPLLFLQRAGKLLCCKNSNASGKGRN